MSAAPDVALLGDSVFDNGAYTGGDPDVLSHLRSLLPAPWRATLLAVDGSRIGDLSRQLHQVPADLRLVCTEPADFVYQIEPSGWGGRKIAQAVAQALGVGEDEPAASRVYPG